MSTMYRRNEQFIAASMGEEIVMMDVASGKYYSLGVTGGAIWKILEKPSSLDGIVDELLKEFQVEREICRTQVESFLNDVVEKGMVCVTEG